MSKSPLSGAFADSSATTTKKRTKKNGAILLVSGIALATSIGGVFAANSITINSGASIQFGQGVAATSTCDSDGLTTTLTQAFQNGDNSFHVDDVVVGGIDSSACSQTTLRVGLVDDDGDFIHSYTVVRPSSATDTEDVSGSNIDAGEVKKITVTTENAQ